LSSEQQGRAGVAELLTRRVAFDAVFAASDLIAIGAIHALSDAGLRVPQDVAVMGFDDIPAASLSSPPLTTLMQDLKQGGELLVETLIAQIEDRPAPDRTLPANLVVRKSTAG
jgi:DNA-binding LacI/PurR family transcriptional regulator